MKGLNMDVAMVISLLIGFGLGVIFMVLSTASTGSPQPHCGVCVCP